MNAPEIQIQTASSPRSPTPPKCGRFEDLTVTEYNRGLPAKYDCVFQPRLVKTFAWFNILPGLLGAVAGAIAAHKSKRYAEASAAVALANIATMSGVPALRRRAATAKAGLGHTMSTGGFVLGYAWLAGPLWMPAAYATLWWMARGRVSGATPNRRRRRRNRR